MLVRARKDFGDLHAVLVGRGVPVEVVGLGGLLQLPEVSDVVATLEVIEEPTANAALLRLLTGPRWRPESALAIVFSHTPAQLEYEAQPLRGHEALPTRLQEVCKGIASDGQGKPYIVIDPQRLMDALSIELSII